MAKPIIGGIGLERVRELLAYDPQTGLFTRRINRRKWRAGQIAGGMDSQGYIAINVDGRRYKAHRLAWLWMTGSWPTKEIDHINGVRIDNRFVNLRDVTNSWNNQNRRKALRNNKVGFLGTFRFRKNFQAQISLDGKSIHLGTFATAEEARAAYLVAKRKWHPGWTS